MKTLAIALQKGGVGKTTVAVNLAFALTRKGKSILLIDLDPQESLTEYFFPNLTNDETPFKETIYTVFTEERKVSPINIIKGLDFIPSTVDLSSAELNLPGQFNPQRILASVLKSYGDKYDFVIIDCPPSLGILTINALTASQKVLIPTTTELMAARTIKIFLNTIDKVRTRELNPGIKIWRILPTMYNRSLNHHKEVLEGYKNLYDKLVYLEPMALTTKYKDAVTSKTDVQPFDKGLGEYWDRLASKLINDWED